MPDPAGRPYGAATVAHARDPGDAADPDLAVDLIDALLALRTARERLHRVDALLGRLVATLTQDDGGEP